MTISSNTQKATDIKNCCNSFTTVAQNERKIKMKNKSLQNPFPSPIDKFFDKNKDGKLGTIETIFRDTHISEMKKKQDELKMKR